MRAYESISMHMHAHAALTLFYKRHQMTQITSRNHTAWGQIRRVGLLVNTAYPMQSVKTRMR